MEAVQTVTPWKAHDGDRRPRRISAASKDAEELALRGRMCMVLFYERPLEDGNGWNLAGKLKGSLNAALAEEPVLAGRLRRRTEGKDGAGVGLEVKFTDSGARLAQARAEGGMSEFLPGKPGGEDVHRLLTYWRDVDERDVDYSPLFTVQLTVFEGEGFTIGVSASLLLSDPLVVASFLSTWSRIHNKMYSSNGLQEKSIFHLSNFWGSGGKPRFINDVGPVYGVAGQNHPVRTVLFREAAAGEDQGKTESPLATLLESCFSGNDGEPEPFYLFDNGLDGALLKVSMARGAERFLDDKTGSAARCFRPVSAEEGMGGFQEVSFEACHPTHVSYAVDSGGGRGVIVVLDSSAAGRELNAGAMAGGAALLSVTVPVGAKP